MSFFEHMGFKWVFHVTDKASGPDITCYYTLEKNKTLLGGALVPDMLEILGDRNHETV